MSREWGENVPESISIVMKMTEDVTGKLKSISSTSQGCSKQFEELQRRTTQLGQRYTDFNKKAAETAAQALGVKKQMDEAAKAFKKTGDEADKVRFQSLKEEYDDLTDAAKGYTLAAKETVKDMNAVYQEARKLQDSSDSSGGFFSKIFSSFTGDNIRTGLMNSGLLKELSSSVSGMMSTVIESAVGQPDATLWGELTSGAFSGAAAGAVAGWPGMIVGAVTGALSGGIAAKTEQFAKEDDAFKSYYAELNDTVNTNTAGGLTSGKTLAATRETNRLAFINELGGEAQADAFLADVLETANSTPFLYDDLTSISKTLLSFGYAVEDVIPTLTKVGDAGAAKGLAASDIGTVATYLGRMKSSNKASLEYLNPLSERGFSVFQWLADDLDVSVAKVYEKISKSELSGTYVSDLILSKFEELYGGMMETQSKSTEGLDSTLQGLQENIQAAQGDSYNQLRNESKEADITAYSGALGEKLSELGAITGQVEAYGENLADQFQREALSAVLLGENTSVYSQEDVEKLEELRAAYVEAEDAWNNGSMEAGQKMTDLKEDAEALATAAYESSDWSQKMHQADLDQIEAIRELTANLKAYTNALEVSNAYSKGIASTWHYGGFASYEDAVIATGGDAGVLEAIGAYDGSHAFGLKRVPYDGYRAILHEGERVMTAAENRSGAEGSVVVQVSGNEFIVRGENDIDAIARQIAVRVREAQETYGG